MGCWNGTCAITNLPILAGEEVYVFLLQESSSYEKYEGNHCHSNTYYQPLPLYFEGEYNDYGAVENCQGDFLDDIFGSVKDRLFEMPEGKNKYHDIPISKDKFDEALFFEADHESRLFVTPWSYEKNRGTEKQRLTHVTVRKDVMNDLIENFKIESWRHEKPLEFETVFEEEYVKFQKEMKRCNELLKVADGLVKVEDELSISQAITSTALEHILPCSYAMRAYCIKQSVINPSELIRKYMTDEVKLKALFRQFTVNMWVESLMGQSRRQWIKPSGSGSQDSETNAQEMIATLITNGAAAVKKQMEEWE